MSPLQNPHAASAGTTHFPAHRRVEEGHIVAICCGNRGRRRDGGAGGAPDTRWLAPAPPRQPCPAPMWADGLCSDQRKNVFLNRGLGVLPRGIHAGQKGCLIPRAGRPARPRTALPPAPPRAPREPRAGLCAAGAGTPGLTWPPRGEPSWSPGCCFPGPSCRVPSHLLGSLGEGEAASWAPRLEPHWGGRAGRLAGQG